MTEDMEEKEEVEWYRSQLRAQHLLRGATVNLGMRQSKEWSHKQMISHLRDQLYPMLDIDAVDGDGDDGKGMGLGEGHMHMHVHVQVQHVIEENGAAGIPLDTPPVAAEGVDDVKSELGPEDDDDDLNYKVDGHMNGSRKRRERPVPLSPWPTAAAPAATARVRTRTRKQPTAPTRSVNPYEKKYETNKRAKKTV